MSNQPEWGGEQSGFDDFELLIEEAKFGYNERQDAAVGRNELRLLLSGTGTLADGKQLPVTDQGWKIGKGWDVIDGGASVAKEDGSELKALKNPFNYQTGMSKFVRAAIACGAGEILNTRCGGDPSNLVHAGVWVGLKFRLQKLPQDPFENDKGETVSYGLLLPTEFLGEVGGPSSAGGSTGTTTSSSATSNGTNGSLEDLVASNEDKMAFLSAAVKAGHDISEAERAWDTAKVPTA